jgi:hypothetical protein
MRLLRDFLCKDCHKVTEEYIDVDTESIKCGCGGTAHKEVSCPQYVKIGEFRSTIDSEAWAKDRSKRNKRIAENEGL